jgi:hypothetical protein
VGRLRPMGGPGPLWWRAPLRLLGSGAWGLLVVVSFGLLAVAAAAVPLFANVTRDAALASTLRQVPPGAPASESAVLRVNGGRTDSLDMQRHILSELAAIPGLGRPTVVGASVGVELARNADQFTPVVVAGGHSAQARLYGVDSPAAALVPAPGSPTAAQAGTGVWLPEPLARELAVAAGASIAVGVDSATGRTRAAVRVAGVYRVAGNGRLPVDPAGAQWWAPRRGELPLDSGGSVRPAYLVVADLATASRLAEAVGDTLLWSVQARLYPAVPTLAQARATAAAIQDLQRDLLDPSIVDIAKGPLRVTAVSGLPDLVAQAGAVGDATVTRTRTMAWASVALGLAAVLAVAVLGMARRRLEMRLDAGLGVRPAAVAARALLEVLPAAGLAMAVSVPVGRLAITALGPDFAGVSAAATAQAWGTAAVAVLAGLALVVAVAGTGAAVAVAGLRGAWGLRWRVPWEALLGACAFTAALSLRGRSGLGQAPGPLDLFTPLLVFAAVGALGERLVVLAWRYLARASRSAARARPRTRPRRPRVPAVWLAARRLAAPGTERPLVLAVLAAGLGMLLYAVAAGASVAAVTTDRIAVLSGASAIAQLDASWQLDPSAPAAPAGAGVDTRQPLPAVGDPPVPAGTSVVWRDTAVTIPGQDGYKSLMVISPASFATAANWGEGPELRRARGLLPALAAAGKASARQFAVGNETAAVPVLIAGRTDLRPGDRASVVGAGSWLVPVRVQVVAVLDAFPGQGTDPLLVVPSSGFFEHLKVFDPRRRPAPGELPSTAEFTPYLWSSHGTAELNRVLAAAGVSPRSVSSVRDIERLPVLLAARRALGYLAVLGGTVAVFAVVALALYADRVATRTRAAEVMLVMVGMARRAPARARLFEVFLMTGAALALAAAGAAVIARLGPLGLDPGGGPAPAFALRVGWPAVAVAAGGALVAVLVAGGVSWLRGRQRSDAEVLRDAE